jgi:hypothetical protein
MKATDITLYEFCIAYVSHPSNIHGVFIYLFSNTLFDCSGYQHSFLCKYYLFLERVFIIRDIIAVTRLFYYLHKKLKKSNS